MKYRTYQGNLLPSPVALFTRAWIEIDKNYTIDIGTKSPSLRGRGLKLRGLTLSAPSQPVALFTRAWIEIPFSVAKIGKDFGRPLYEGVD